MSFTGATEADDDGVGEALDVHPAATSANDPSNTTKVFFMAIPPTCWIALGDPSRCYPLNQKHESVRTHAKDRNLQQIGKEKRSVKE